MSDSDGIIEPIDDGGDDLFGDEGDDDIVPTKEESVNEDDELASDPEGDTYARYRNDDEDQAQLETKERAVQTVTTYRHRTPKPKDGAVCAILLRATFEALTDLDPPAASSSCSQVHENHA